MEGKETIKNFVFAFKCLLIHLKKEKIFFLLKFPAVVFTQEIQYFLFLLSYLLTCLPAYLIDPQSERNDLMLINIVSESNTGKDVT